MSPRQKKASLAQGTEKSQCAHRPTKEGDSGGNQIGEVGRRSCCSS